MNPQQHRYELRLLNRNEILTIIPLLQILDPTISVPILEKRLGEMINQGYQCLAVFDKTRLIATSGLWVMTRYYCGKYVEPDNVIVDPDYQNKGLGKIMMTWIYTWAKDQGCEASELNAYVANSSAQRFWMNEGYRILGFHFQKKLC